MVGFLGRGQANVIENGCRILILKWVFAGVDTSEVAVEWANKNVGVDGQGGPKRDPAYANLDYSKPGPPPLLPLNDACGGVVVPMTLIPLVTIV
jgi:hypothetical protein